MKIAAAEAQWETCQPCSFSMFQIGGGNNDETPTQIIEIPHLLSILATGTWNGQVVGLNELQAQYEQQYGPGNYIPNVFIQYWSMRVMAYLGTPIVLLALWGAWLLHRRKLERARWFLAHRHLGGHRAVPHEHRRLDADRERAPTVDRPGADEDRGRRVALGQRDRDLDQPRSSSSCCTPRWPPSAGFLMVRYARRPLPEDGQDDHGPQGHHRRRVIRRQRHRADRVSALTYWRPDLSRGADMGLQITWFVIVAVFWTGFFVLEGFDFGVGILHMVVGKTDTERRVAINTIGPFWDGNEVWLVVAGAAIFAAFPSWYATWFSALYLALMIVLVGAHRARRLLRVPRQGRRARAGGPRGAGR